MGDTTALKIVESRANMPEKRFATKEDFINSTNVNSTLMGILEDYGLFSDIRDSNQLSIFDFE
jgi:DNA polymerase-3 subunit alpha (Gram-positive type)